MTSVIHPDSKQILDATVRQSPHALLLTGPMGIGLATITKEFIAKQSSFASWVLPEKDEKIDLEKGSITVESIRRLYELTRTIEPKGRIIVIDYAERMAPAAQNAFLKLLEEPTEGTRFILLTHAPETMLPTITSRAQRVDFRPATHAQSEELLNTLEVSDATKRTQLLFIAEGLPAALTRLADDTATFEQRAAVMKDARTLITGSAYERLLLAKKYKDSRPDALLLLADAMKLLRRTMAASGDEASLKLLARFEQIHKRITEQGNVRLQLSAAVL